MNRRTFLRGIGAGAASLAVSRYVASASAAESGGRRPNFTGLIESVRIYSGEAL
jgi:hypothetical protein